MKSGFYILTAICLVIVCYGCGNTLSQPERPEDIVIELDTLAETPKSFFRDFKAGDDVAVIKADGTFDISGNVQEIDQSKGYNVQTGTTRSAAFGWFAATQLFPVPWSDSSKLKVGDEVYRIHFGDFGTDKGMITELPQSKSGNIYVKFANRTKTESVERKIIFSSIETADAGKLSIGDIVYFNNYYWAMVVGKRDGKIIIRESGFPAKDKLVSASKLQTMR